MHFPRIEVCHSSQSEAIAGRHLVRTVIPRAVLALEIVDVEWLSRRHPVNFSCSTSRQSRIPRCHWRSVRVRAKYACLMPRRGHAGKAVRGRSCHHRFCNWNVPGRRSAFHGITLAKGIHGREPCRKTWPVADAAADRQVRRLGTGAHRPGAVPTAVVGTKVVVASRGSIRGGGSRRIAFTWSRAAHSGFGCGSYNPWAPRRRLLDAPSSSPSMVSAATRPKRGISTQNRRSQVPSSSCMGRRRASLAG